MDAGAWIARFNRRDSWHNPLAPAWRTLLESKAPLMTTSLVLVEVFAHVQNDARGYKPAFEIARRLLLGSDSQPTIVRPTPSNEAGALGVWGELGRFGLDWVDAMSVHVARKSKATVFTTNPDPFTAANLAVIPNELRP